MPALLALPLAPVLFPGTTAAAVTFLVGSSVYLADGIYGFRRPVSLPGVTGLEGVATLTEKVADYLAAARAPVGFPMPPPLQDPRAAAAAVGVWTLGKATDVLAQIWGYFKQSSPTPAANTLYPSGPWEVASGNYLRLCVGVNSNCYSNLFRKHISLVRGPLVNAFYGAYSWTHTYELASGAVQAVVGVAQTEAEMRARSIVLYPGGTVTAYGTIPASLRQETVPEIEAEPEALPALVPPTPLPLPGPAPDGEPLPEVEPITEPAELPALPPAIPAAPPLTAPAFPEEPRRINNSGVLIPLAPTPAAITPTDAHYPVPGGAPVGSIAKAPAATLAAIAVEVGRVEQKLERLLNPLASDNAGDLLKLVWDAAQQIIAAQLDNREGGEYVLSSPCELDGNGDRIESTVTYPETEDNFQAVLVRLDALAALLQTHKDLKQPICRQTPAVGQPVTVNFVQIE